VADVVRYEVVRGVAVLTLAQPENHNALSVELVDALRASVDAALSDEGVRALLLTNEGPTFCAGADLRADGGRGGSPAAFPSILSDLMDGPKPVVGRIAGGCFGGGVGLAAACDISVVVDTARIGFTEVRIGVAPAVIAVVCLPKLQRADALELFLTGERISAARAVEVGLLTATASAADLDEVVEAYLDKLRLGGPQALAACKELVRRLPSMPRSEAFRWTAELSAARFASDEAAEGIAAFRAKRPARWARG
jgi:methylglutaconyl-CoA hydratase